MSKATASYLILKYGSLAKAYVAWLDLDDSGSAAEFSDEDKNCLVNWNMSDSTKEKIE